MAKTKLFNTGVISEDSKIVYTIPSKPPVDAEITKRDLEKIKTATTLLTTRPPIIGARNIKDFTIITPQSIIIKVLNKYKDKLSDSTSNESLFFSALNKFSTSEELELFDIVYKRLDAKNDINIDEYFKYINENNLSVDYSSIYQFIIMLDAFRIKIIREKLFNNTYEDYGNIYNFFLNNTEANNLFFIDTLENDSLFSENKDFLLTAKIDYIKTDSYRNFREAEEDYWEIIEKFYIANDFSILTKNKSVFFEYGEPAFTKNFSRKILDILLNKHARGLSNGIPILLNKKSSKNSFSFISKENDNISRLLKRDYKKLDRKYFYVLLNDFIIGVTKYLIKKNAMDYINDESIPDIREFIESELLSISNSNFDIDVLKKYKFYKYFICKFFNFNIDIEINSSLDIDLHDTELEFDRLAVLIEELIRKLVTDGKFF